MNTLPTIVSIYDHSSDMDNLKGFLTNKGFDVITPTKEQVDQFCLSCPTVSVVIIDYPLQETLEISQKLQLVLPDVNIIWFSRTVERDQVVTAEGVSLIALKKPLSEEALLKVVSYCVKSSDRNRQLNFINVKAAELQNKLKRLGVSHGNLSNQT